MATKFVSALTGPEMDQALTDMAYHNSEAYAVGTRNGVAVGSSDVTYHNNSKYWAEQVYGYTDRAEDAANRAEAAVPSGTAGAVFFDRAQTLTTAQQSQARANIMAGGSNRNLLDNPWFTVNQRGLTTMSSASYAMDRWKCDNAITNGMVCSNGVVTLASNTVFAQRIEPTLMEFLKGKTVTASILKSDGTVVSATNVVNSSGSTGFSNVGGIDLSPIRFRVVGGVAIKAVKLELGSVSTLANDAPPNYAEELAKCQRYFVRISNTSGVAMTIGYAVKNSATNVWVNVATPVELRIVPTTTFSGTHRVFGGGAGSRDISTYSTYGKNAQGVLLLATISSGSIADNEVFVVYAASGAYVDFSADL